MNATIFKNDEFKTVGLKVTAGDHTMFTWGCTFEGGYYTKTINADKYTDRIVELIQLKRMHRYFDGIEFTEDVFDIWRDERNQAKLKEGESKNGVFFPNNKEEEIKAQIERIIETIK